MRTAWVAREAAHPSRPQSAVTRSGGAPDPDSEALGAALLAILLTAMTTAAVLTGWVPTPLAP